MTDLENKQLSRLVLYLLESEDWKHCKLSPYQYSIHLFIQKTGIEFNTVIKYVRNAMTKLVGNAYSYYQYKLKYLLQEKEPLEFCLPSNPAKQKQLKQPKPKKIKPPKPKKVKPSKPVVDGTVKFSKLYREHFKISSTRNFTQYAREKYFYDTHGYPSWEKEQEQ